MFVPTCGSEDEGKTVTKCPKHTGWLQHKINGFGFQRGEKISHKLTEKTGFAFEEMSLLFTGCLFVCHFFPKWRSLQGLLRLGLCLILSFNFILVF